MDEPQREVWRHAQHMSNAHLVRAAMPTILAAVETMAAGEGIRATGIEINGRDASVTLDGKIAVGLVKHMLKAVDDACAALLSDAPALPSLEAKP